MLDIVMRTLILVLILVLAAGGGVVACYLYLRVPRVITFGPDKGLINLGFHDRYRLEAVLRRAHGDPGSIVKRRKTANGNEGIGHWAARATLVALAGVVAAEDDDPVLPAGGPPLDAQEKAEILFNLHQSLSETVPSGRVEEMLTAYQKVGVLTHADMAALAPLSGSSYVRQLFRRYPDPGAAYAARVDVNTRRRKTVTT